MRTLLTIPGIGCVLERPIPGIARVAASASPVASRARPPGHRSACPLGLAAIRPELVWGFVCQRNSLHAVVSVLASSPQALPGILCRLIRHEIHSNGRGQADGNPLLTRRHDGSERTEGSPPVRANLAPRPCIRLDPPGVRTMKQPCASGARLRGSGPILTTASNHAVTRVATTSDRHQRPTARARPNAETVFV
jgi:hypothetical protein